MVIPMHKSNFKTLNKDFGVLNRCLGLKNKGELEVFERSTTNKAYQLKEEIHKYLMSELNICTHTNYNL